MKCSVPTPRQVPHAGAKSNTADTVLLFDHACPDSIIGKDGCSGSGDSDLIETWECQSKYHRVVVVLVK